MAHPGIRTTVKMISQRFVWPNISRDCTDWARSCIPCQQSKIHRHTKSPVSQFTTEYQRFSHVHVDIVGPLPPCQGYRYILTCVDRFTRWPEAIPLSQIDAETVAEAFYHGWVARFGAPRRITTDQGRQFDSQLFSETLRLLGIERTRTTAYHPAANGMVERMHRQLKAAIKAQETERWLEVLPIVLLGLRAAYKEDLKASAAELVYGQELRLPGEFFIENRTCTEPCEFVKTLRRQLNSLRPTPAAHHIGAEKIFIHPDLRTTTYVFLRDDTVLRPLQRPYTGPHLVVDRRDKVFKIRVRENDKWVSIDRLKPAYVEDKEEPAKKAETTTEPTPTTTLGVAIRTRAGRTCRAPIRFQGSLR